MLLIDGFTDHDGKNRSNKMAKKAKAKTGLDVSESETDSGSEINFY